MDGAGRARRWAEELAREGEKAWAKARVWAVIDSTVDLRHVSFRGDGLPVPPPWWCGKCEEPAGGGDVRVQ